jgi:general secretion pathway protein A
MYLNFYGLKTQPFHITPDPEFLYLSPSHKEALAAIVYGIKQRKGFVAIVGAVGVGKTTILRSYLEMADKKRLKIIYIFNARLNFKGLLQSIYQELGMHIEGSDVVEMVNRLYEFLIEEYKRGNTCVLVVDEVQNMPISTLEDLRMLSNLETSKDKLIQIVLVGQPEFEEGLKLDRLKQLRQRLAIKATIRPLTNEESLDYIKFRLQRAGSNYSSIFTISALKKILKKAQGIPRVLNVLCDNALITGFGYHQKPITVRIVHEIINDYEGLPSSIATRWWRAAASAIVVAALIVFLVIPMKDTLVRGIKSMSGFKKAEDVSSDMGLRRDEVTKETAKQIQPRIQPEARQQVGVNETSSWQPSQSPIQQQTVKRKKIARREANGQAARNPPEGSDEKVLELIQDANSQVTRSDLIHAGSSINSQHIPSLPPDGR